MRNLNFLNVPKYLILLLLFVAAAPALAQEEELSMEAQQEKMMETQFFMQQLMMLGHNEELLKELEVVDDQAKDVKELAQNYQKDMMNFYTENRDLIAELQKASADQDMELAAELGKEFQKKNTDFAQGYMDRVSEVLLPHQVDRLKQIAKQQRVKMTNQFSDEFGVAVSLADELGLSAAEKKRLIEATKEARKEYYDAVKAAKKKAFDKIKSVLTTEQQEKMKEALGDEWDQEAMLRKTREEALQKQREAMKKQEEAMKK